MHLLRSAIGFFLTDRQVWTINDVSPGDAMPASYTTLTDAGYLMIRPKDYPQRPDLCDTAQTYVFFYAKAPTFSYAIRVDGDCAVASIFRRLLEGP